MSLTAAAACCLLLFAGPASAPAQAGSGAQLLMVSQFHGDEIQAKSGEHWFALCRRETAYELRDVTINVEAVPDSLGGDKGGERTGRKVTVQGENTTPILLVKGIDGLRKGPVKSYFEGCFPLLPVRKDDLTFCDRYFRLGSNENPQLLATGTLLDDMCLKDYHLLYNNKEIFKAEYSDVAVPELLWAGDLDRDGKTDFLLNLTTKYVTTSWVLFLSSKADSGKDLSAVARLDHCADCG